MAVKDVVHFFCNEIVKVFTLIIFDFGFFSVKAVCEVRDFYERVTFT
jgi:hypothetical protein